MSYLKLTLMFMGAGLISVTGVGATPADAAPPPPDFCISQATAECTDGANLGYPDFATCGQAREAACHADLGGGGGGGGGNVGGTGAPPIINPPANACYPNDITERQECAKNFE